MTRPDWMQHAICRDVDPEVFFPTPPNHSGWGGRQAHIRQAAVNAAIEVCQPCTVRAECLAYAMQFGIRDGIWGGLDLESPQLIRKALRREQGRHIA